MFVHNHVCYGFAVYVVGESDTVTLWAHVPHGYVQHAVVRSVPEDRGVGNTVALRFEPRLRDLQKVIGSAARDERLGVRLGHVLFGYTRYLGE